MSKSNNAKVGCTFNYTQNENATNRFVKVSPIDENTIVFSDYEISLNIRDKVTNEDCNKIAQYLSEIFDSIIVTPKPYENENTEDCPPASNCAKMCF